MTTAAEALVRDCANRLDQLFRQDYTMREVEAELRRLLRAALAQPQEGDVEECECPVEGHLLGCPRDNHPLAKAYRATRNGHSPPSTAGNTVGQAGLTVGPNLDGESPAQPALAQEPVALRFDAFRAANVARCLKWHPLGIESWSASDWITAIVGELGELASFIKMRNRERDGLPGNKFSPTDKQIADELADVVTYLDLLAAMLGIDLGSAAVEKFNEVSERLGFPDRITLAAPQPDEAVALLREAYNELIVDPEQDEATRAVGDALVERIRAYLARTGGKEET